MRILLKLSSIIIFYFIAVIHVGCAHDNNDNIHSVGLVKEWDLCPRILDSLETWSLLRQAVTTQYIGHTPASYELPIRTDLEYMPYLMIILQEPDRAPYDLSPLVQELVSICTKTIDDKELFSYGKRIYSKLYDFKDEASSNYPLSFSKDREPTYNFVDLPPYELERIDTMRVRALIHNDRLALKELEEYYHAKGKAKDLAIYYKVMLSYEGNGDLAEKFFYVLQPYFKYRPEVRASVREVLLRAAICDGNERAQELCDSLGISFCDYRLPLPE